MRVLLSTFLLKNVHRSAAVKVLKILLVIIMTYVVYNQVSGHLGSFRAIKSVLTSLKGVFALLVVVLLMPFNWFLEVKKWQYLVSKFQSITTVRATKSVLSGVTLGLVTPGRIGEYGGKLVGIDPENIPKAILANGVNSISQNVPNISIGLLAILFYVQRFLDISQSAFVGLLGLTLIALGVLLFIFFNLEIISGVFKKYNHRSFINKLLSQSAFLETYSTKELIRVLVYSFARYGVYTLQYAILILLLGITSDPFIAFVGVSVIYFIQTGIPLPPVLSVLARGEVAIWVWSVCTGDVFSVLSATFMLWCINLVIPALVGMLIIWRSKLL